MKKEPPPSPFSNLQERKKLPFFIQEATLAKTLEQIEKVPAEKRRIIVYAGVHPNEGTAKLAKKYAEQWAEKYPVLVVCQPTEETPHAIWKRREALIGADGEIPPLPADKLLDQEAYEEKFALGNETFFIEFHGTPIVLGPDESKKDRKLDIKLSRRATHPEDFRDRRHEARFQRPDIVQGLDAVVPDVHEEERQNDHRWYPQAGNTMVVEYFYEGQPNQIDDPYFQKLIKRYNAEKMEDYEDPSAVTLLSKENWHRQMNIGAEYLEQYVLTEEDEQQFEEVFAARFEAILKHLSGRLP